MRPFIVSCFLLQGISATNMRIPTRDHMFAVLEKVDNVLGKELDVLMKNSDSSTDFCHTHDPDICLKGSDNDVNHRFTSRITEGKDFEDSPPKVGDTVYFTNVPGGSSYPTSQEAADALNGVVISSGVIAAVDGTKLTITWKDGAAPAGAPEGGIETTTPGLLRGTFGEIGYLGAAHYSGEYVVVPAHDLRKKESKLIEDGFALYQSTQRHSAKLVELMNVLGEETMPVLTDEEQEAKSLKQRIAYLNKRNEQMKQQGASSGGSKWRGFQKNPDWQKVIKDIFMEVAGEEFCDSGFEIGRNSPRCRGPPNKCNLQQYSAGVHTDIGDVKNWRDSFGSHWYFTPPPHANGNACTDCDDGPSLECIEKCWSEHKLQDYMKNYRHFNMWMPFEKYENMPLAVSMWQFGRKNSNVACMTGVCEADQDEAHKAIWYSPKTMQLGEVFIFDGHNLIIHEALTTGGSTPESRAERFSLELRIRCKCRVQGCGLPPFEQQWPYKAPTSFDATKDVAPTRDAPDRSEVNKAEEDILSNNDLSTDTKLEEVGFLTGENDGND